MRAAASHLGAVALAQLWVELELVSCESEPDRAAQLLARFTDELERVCAALRLVSEPS